MSLSSDTGALPQQLKKQADYFIKFYLSIFNGYIACSSGNFLTETYISLKLLENKALRSIYDGQKIFNLDGLIKVGIHQFYGIEINDFAVTVAKTALWIAES